MQWGSPLIAVAVTFLVGAAAFAAMGEPPLAALHALFVAPLSDLNGVAELLLKASPLCLIALGLAVGFRSNIWDIGAEGQMYIGGLGLTWAVLALDAHLPGILMIPLAMIGAAVFGALWAFIPGYLQAKRGSHVVVTTIMFNFIAANVMNWLILKLIPEGQQNPASRVFADSAALPLLNKALPFLGDAPLNISFLLAIVALVIYGVVVWRSSWGYQLRATGLNAHAAHYAGVKISRTIIVTMLVSGALAGLGAVNSVMGSTHYLSLNFPAGAGFVGIAIALMGRQHPVGIFLSSVLFGALIQGGFDLSLEKPNIPQETFIFIQGLIILFCGAMENFYAPAILKLINVTRSTKEA